MPTKRDLTGAALSAVGGLLSGGLIAVVALPHSGDDPGSGLVLLLLTCVAVGGALVPGALWATRFSRSPDAIRHQSWTAVGGGLLVTGAVLIITRFTSTGELGLVEDAVGILTFFTGPAIVFAIVVLRGRARRIPPTRL